VVALKECGPPALLVAGEGYVVALADHPGDDQTEALRASPVVRGSARGAVPPPSSPCPSSPAIAVLTRPFCGDSQRFLCRHARAGAVDSKMRIMSFRVSQHPCLYPGPPQVRRQIPNHLHPDGPLGKRLVIIQLDA
jgi:hypothetical protein